MALLPVRKYFLQLIYFGIALALLSGKSFCQTLPFQDYTTRDGLPSNHITALRQDSRGYLWIGTDNGLSMYDGTEFKNFTTADGLSNLYITDIIESRTHPGTFWIGTIAGGLVRMSNGRFSIFHVGDNNIGSLYEDVRGVVWISAGKGNFRVINDSVAFVCATSPQGSNIQAMGDSIVVIFTEHEVRRYDLNGDSSRTDTLNLAKGEHILATAGSSQGDLWGMSSNRTLLHIDRSLTTYYRLRITDRFSPDIPPSIVDDDQGSLWLTTDEGILVINKTDRTIRSLRPLGSKREQRCGPILHDHEGIIWVGTYANGLLKLGEQRITRISIRPVAEGAYNMVACSDSSGHIWISTETSLLEVTRSRDNQWKVFRRPINPRITEPMDEALLIDPQNKLWVGPTTGQTSFYCYEIEQHGDAGSTLELVKSLSSKAFTSRGVGLTFAIDRLERGWFSVIEPGVTLVDLHGNTAAQTFTKSDGLPTDAPRALLVDRTKKLWYGSWAEGLAVIEQQGDTFSVTKGPAIFSGAGVRSLYEDRDGSIWIGTRYGGLVRYRNGQYVGISVSNGLLSNAIWSIAETDHYLWCGTDVGLETVDKKTCRPLPTKPELIGNRVYACGAYKNDYVWCVHANELVVYDHPEQTSNTPPPPVYIKSYSVNGVLLSPDTLHEFNHTQNSCTIDFVGISFKDEHSVRYQYRMVGHDSLWTNPMKEHTVTYASLRPGAYEFDVRAINVDGVTSTRPASISFVIVPPVWYRWWFIAGAGLLSFSIIYGLFRYRLHHLMKLEQLRLRIASDLHDDVASTLSSIAFFTESLRRQVDKPSHQAMDLLDKISGLALEAEDAVGDIVWSVAPQHDTLQELFVRMRDFGSDICTANGIEFSAVFNERESPIRLSDVLRKHLYLVFKEAVHNVIKHSRAATVRFELFFDHRSLHLVLTDDGIGFTPSGEIGNHESVRGHGLRNMVRRAESLRGSLTIDSLSGKGTTVTLIVPMT